MTAIARFLSHPLQIDLLAAKFYGTGNRPTVTTLEMKTVKVNGVLLDLRGSYERLHEFLIPCRQQRAPPGYVTLAPDFEPPLRNADDTAFCHSSTVFQKWLAVESCTQPNRDSSFMLER